MEVMPIVESLFRWIHVVAGVLWIGLLYFFNWVNANVMPKLDGETKKKLVPELMPRALYWFRWGAAFTWVTGLFLLLWLFYHHKLALQDPDAGLGILPGLMLILVLVAPFIYDPLAKGPLKDPQTAFGAGVVLATVLLFVFEWVGGFGYRGYSIHLGATFGTIMAFNVWFRIWPAQQKIIAATKNGEAPDPALVALAGTRSKHNTYMSVPLIFMMINQHTTWVGNPIVLSLFILIGWGATYWLYGKATEVKGF
jgi:uncharacterized membrane protein